MQGEIRKEQGEEILPRRQIMISEIHNTFTKFSHNTILLCHMKVMTSCYGHAGELIDVVRNIRQLQLLFILGLIGLLLIRYQIWPHGNSE